MATTTIRPMRRAFTLIELLVVITIILLLMGLTYMFYPSQGQRKMVTAADKISMWLLIAKQQAKRDNRATGVRLIADPANPNNIIQMIYVQQPEDYAPQNSTAIAPGTGVVTFQPAGVLLGSAQTGGQADLAPAQAGDYIEFNRGGGVSSIKAVDPTGTVVQLQDNGPSIGGTVAVPYRIIRQPRKLLGEEDLNLPDGVAILSPAYVPQPALPSPPGSLNVPSRIVDPTLPPYYEIMFSPAGNVIGQGVGQDKVYLWLFDTDILTSTIPTDLPNNPLPQKAQPAVIIAIQVRTGLIGTYATDPPPSTDAYFQARTGRSSGM